VDRHEHVGKGKIGRNGFRHFLTDPRFAELPGLIETESDAEMKYDKMNLRTLRRLAAYKS
ncbi:MAG TPA: deoxyribonuclease IV, partial [Anaerolineae bacterium]